jgi:hypothetical protein
MDRGESRRARIASLALLSIVTAAFAASLATPVRRPPAQAISADRCRAFIMKKADEAAAAGDVETARELDSILDLLSPPRHLAAR